MTPPTPSNATLIALRATPILSLRRAALRQQRVSPFALRPFSSIYPRRAEVNNTTPPPRLSTPNSEKVSKSTTPGEDPQSNASQQEHKTGDDHPAKQPDPQAEVTRSTGFGNVKGPVEGGKEGLKHRSDRDGNGE
jgi:hypothetical protein